MESRDRLPRPCNHCLLLVEHDEKSELVSVLPRPCHCGKWVLSRLVPVIVVSGYLVAPSNFQVTSCYLVCFTTL